MKKVKSVGAIILGIILILVLMSGDSFATLQVNGSTPTAYPINTWMSEFRKMEASEANGGSLGLTETIGTGLLCTSESNNLDCHMEKNTEYGAVAILSASSYGNPEKIESGDTTTGNASGVVMNINKEWVAAGIIHHASNFAGANKRYKDSYSEGANCSVTYVVKNGDAISETAGWHGSGASSWISSAWKYGYYGNENWTAYTASYAAGLIRSFSGSIFSYYGYNNSNGGLFSSRNNCPRNVQAAQYTYSYASRPVIVVGEGF